MLPYQLYKIERQLLNWGYSSLILGGMGTRRLVNCYYSAKKLRDPNASFYEKKPIVIFK